MVTSTAATGSHARVSSQLVAATGLAPTAGKRAGWLSPLRFSAPRERIGETALIRRVWSVRVQIAKGMRLNRTTTSSGSGHRSAVRQWRRHPRHFGTVVLLIALLAGMLPAQQIGGALPTHALPATQRTTERVIIEVTRGANPARVARELGAV